MMQILCIGSHWTLATDSGQRIGQFATAENLARYVVRARLQSRLTNLTPLQAAILKKVEKELNN